MNAALLKWKIQLFGLVTSKTEYGTIETSYELKCSTRAHVIFNSESQVVSEGEIYYPINRTFVVRAYIPVVETDRIYFEGKFWKIMSINKNIFYNDIEIITILCND